MSTKPNELDTKEVKPELDTIQLIEINKLKDFKDHAFKPYKGKRLEQLAQSIKVNGVMQPIIVRAIEDSDMFEIISGHNRTKAVKQAGLTELPAVVRVMSNDEAAILSNETNITQRSFKDWLPSEKAKSIFQYHETVKKQGKRSPKSTDISGGIDQKSDDWARSKTANVYGVKCNIIRLYLEIHRLKDELMDKLDNEEFGVTAAQTLSFISPMGQLLINTVLEEERENYRVTIDNAQKLRDLLDRYEGKDAVEKANVHSEVIKILDREPSHTSKSESISDKIKNIPLAVELYDEWFSDRPVAAAIDVIKAAMKSYREKNSDEPDKTDEPRNFKMAPITSELQ